MILQVVDNVNISLHTQYMNIEFHSHEQQDEFVFNLFFGKTNGFFLDIACGHPRIGSNTYTLEKYNNWNGFGFDVGNVEGDLKWSQHRNSTFVRMDVTSPAMTEYLKTVVPSGQVVDYVSLDVDAAGRNLALPAFERVLDSGIRFKAMTFEHEAYIHGPAVRDQVYNLLSSQGYVPLFEDVRLWAGGLADDSHYNFETWWIDPTCFESKVLEAAGSNLYYFDCVKKLKETMGNDYQAVHLCSNGWPEEYSLYWDDNDRMSKASYINSLKGKR